MSIFSKILNKIFTIFRSGLDKFLAKYKEIAITEVKKLAAINSNRDFHEWKDEAWQAINNQLIADKKEVAGNWVSILLHLVYEQVKAELENKKA